MDFVGNIHDRAPPPPPAYRPRPSASKASSSSTSSAYANSPLASQPTPSTSINSTTIQGQNRNSNDGKGTFYDLIKYKDSSERKNLTSLLRENYPKPTLIFSSGVEDRKTVGRINPTSSNKY